ncbi:MAG: TraB/GumN family protein [Deltaproteobacteria bacterium]|nr:TraB/GumN family protein [Deltaproteobacteria bacterium]MBW2119214.1 TraB/GumN family protein [Deltaproteobacteria bacterium]
MIINYIFKRKSSQWLFGLVLLSLVWALGSTLDARERPATGNGNHFLWSMKTAKNLIYFLGSIHLLKRDSYPLAAEIENAYADCTSIVFETDLDAMKDPAFQALMLTLGLYPEGQTIEQDISEQTYEELKEKMKAAGLPMAQFARFRPWICGQTLTVIELQRLGFNVTYGIDMYFYGKARKDKKKMIFLESAEYQLKLLGEMDKDDQEGFLRQTLKELDVIEEMAPDMLNAWETGDIDGLNEIMAISFKDHPEIHDRLVTLRNRAWISKISNLAHQDGNVLVIVGAGHLIGKENVLHLLEERGYKIRQR